MPFAAPLRAAVLLPQLIRPSRDFLVRDCLPNFLRGFRPPRRLRPLERQRLPPIGALNRAVHARQLPGPVSTISLLRLLRPTHLIGGPTRDRRE